MGRWLDAARSAADAGVSRLPASSELTKPTEPSSVSFVSCGLEESAKKSPEDSAGAQRQASEFCEPLKELAAPAAQHFLTPEKTVDTWEERAAHLEYDAGLPREWAEHFARLIVGEPPGDFSPTRWQAALDGALMFADRWGREAHRLGWDASEVFGLHSTAPAARVDCRGLAWLLGDGSQVVAMDRSGAEIRKPSGGRQRYYRRRPANWRNQ